MIPVLLTALVVLGLPNLYFAFRSREYRKFIQLAQYGVWRLEMRKKHTH